MWTGIRILKSSGVSRYGYYCVELNFMHLIMGLVGLNSKHTSGGWIVVATTPP